MIIEVDIKKVISNEENPRIIKDSKFEKLVNSIKEFPEMLKLRPIVVNDQMIVLGGNMRLKACQEAGLTKVHIIKATDLSEEQQREFIIKDNVGFGEWDWDVLANEWNSSFIENWGLDVWQNPDENYFETNDETTDTDSKPALSDDDYSSFELIMKHENKILLLDTLNKVKREYQFEKQEEALMEILRQHNK